MAVVPARNNSTAAITGRTTTQQDAGTTTTQRDSKTTTTQRQTTNGSAANATQVSTNAAGGHGGTTLVWTLVYLGILLEGMLAVLATGYAVVGTALSRVTNWSPWTPSRRILLACWALGIVSFVLWLVGAVWQQPYAG